MCTFQRVRAQITRIGSRADLRSTASVLTRIERPPTLSSFIILGLGIVWAIHFVIFVQVPRKSSGDDEEDQERVTSTFTTGRDLVGALAGLAVVANLLVILRFWCLPTYKAQTYRKQSSGLGAV